MQRDQETRRDKERHIETKRERESVCVDVRMYRCGDVGVMYS
jgi:hypothetical protein